MDETAIEQVKKKQKEGWIEAQFSFEVMAVTPEIVESALRDHISRMSRAPDTYVYDKSFGKVEPVKSPPAGIKEAYSQVARVKLLTRDFYTMLNIIMVYGPSSVEILSPNKRDLKIDEMQSISNVIAGLMHEFASKGVGGMVISSAAK